MSGTSMASPLAAGAGALYLQLNPMASVDDARSALACGATISAVSGVPADTTSRLLYADARAWDAASQAGCAVSAGVGLSAAPIALALAALFAARAAFRR